MTQMENTRLEKVEDKMGEMIMEMNKLHQGHEEILKALKGGDLTVGRGLVPEVKELRKEVSELKQFKFYMMALWGVSLIIWGVVKDFVLNFFKS